LNNTIATASFNTLSPNTREYRSGSQFSSGLPMIDKVATGSTADISDPNTSASIGDEESIFTRSVSPTKYTKNPTIKVEIIVPKTAYNEIVQKLAKKFD